jgi:hypothetical protein
MSIPILDLHGVKHEDVVDKVEEFINKQEHYRKFNIMSSTVAFTGKIITGNSSKMRTLVEGALHKHKVDYNYISNGSIIISGKL